MDTTPCTLILYTIKWIKENGILLIVIARQVIICIFNLSYRERCVKGKFMPHKIIIGNGVSSCFLCKWLRFSVYREICKVKCCYNDANSDNWVAT